MLPPARPRSAAAAAPPRRSMMVMPAHEAERAPGPMLLMIQRNKQDEKVHSGKLQTCADEAQVSEVVTTNALERLFLGDNRCLEPEALLATASRAGRLQELSLRGTTATNQVVSAFVSSCPDLCVLDISDCDGLTDIARLSTLQDLCELRASRCVDAVTPAFVCSLSALKKLQVLDFSFCPGVTGLALQELARGVRALSHLDLSGCGRLTDAGLVALTQANPGIKHLSLALNAKGLSDDGTVHSLRHLRRLQCLNLSGCSQLTTKTFTAVARYNERLEDVTFSGCKHFLDEDLRQLFNSCSLMIRLDITGCRLLTEECLLEVLPRARGLRWLAVSAIPKLSAQGLARLRSLLPQVDVRCHMRTQADPNDLSLYLGGQVPEKIKKIKAVNKKKNNNADTKGKKKR